MEAKPNSHIIYEFGKFRLDAGQLMLYRDGEELSLPPKAVETLLALIERRGQIVSKDQLMDAIWSDAIVEESNLSRYIHVLRSTLGGQADGSPYIETFRRRGYRFNGQVSVTYHPTQVAFTESATVSTVPNRRREVAVREATTGNVVALADWPRDTADSERFISDEHVSLEGQASVVSQDHNRNRVSISIAAFAVVVLLFVSVYLFTIRTNTPVLTDKDVILIADFENKTGDEIFDGTLKKGLEIQLQQSPFLSLFPDDRVRETLKLMRQSPNESITRDLAKEICLRQGLKAYIAGAIVPLGRSYVISLEAINASTGDIVASEMIQVDGKEQTLDALSNISVRLREKLGESLSSIEKLETPLNVTTKSVEALRLFSLGELAVRSGDYPRAVESYKKATEIDPEFALAYAAQAPASIGAGIRYAARDLTTRAYELRENVSEFEKLSITATYYRQVLDNDYKEIETLELMKQLYPRRTRSYMGLANIYFFVGDYEASIENAKGAIEIGGVPRAYLNLARAYIAQNRYDEATNAADEGLKNGLDLAEFHEHLVSAAFLQGDENFVNQRLNNLAQGRHKSYAFMLKAKIAAYSGRLETAEELFRRAIETAETQETRRDAANHYREMAETLANGGDCKPAMDAAEMRGSKYSEDPFSYIAAIVFAQCGNRNKALYFVEDELRWFPEGVPQNNFTAPVARGILELKNNQAESAIEYFLKVPLGLEPYRGFLLWHSRGQAYLRLNRGKEAILEFQKILDHPGTAPFSPMYPLAYLGLARAQVLTGDLENARANYERFFEVWKDADPDLKPLIEAKREYEALQRRM